MALMVDKHLFYEPPCVRYRGARGNQPVGRTLGESRAPACRCETRCRPDWRRQESPGFLRAECQITLRQPRRSATMIAGQPSERAGARWRIGWEPSAV